MRGSIPLSSAKLINMRDIKKEMTMIKGGDFLEWYDSLDAVDKAQYKVEFNKLQESYATPSSKFNEILDDHKDQFIEDLIQGRIEQAVKDASEWIEESSFECIQEAMSKHDVIPIDEYKEWDHEELQKRFDYIYREAIKTLFNKNSNGC
jgi:23S rRNA G2069 N7-methylase RlmK/C1962 C5-methylase RlmI